MAHSSASPHVPHVVIIGGGFAGLNAARVFNGENVRVTIIDRNNYHLFQPLLYQVATAALSPGQIAYPIRAIVRHQKNAVVTMGEVTSIDLKARKVLLQDSELAYDYLIIATGARHAYFGHPEWEVNAPGLKSLDDALNIRRRILLAFEQAEVETDPIKRQALLTFVIIGGGPTGVEMAGAIREIAFEAMHSDFRHIDTRSARIVLVEAGPRILSSFTVPLSDAGEDALKNEGIQIRKNSPVTAITPTSVTLGGETLAASTVIWAAGVSASPLMKTLGVPLDRSGRALIEPCLNLPGHSTTFVIGDTAAFVHQEGGKALPGVAPVAMQQGKHVAANILLSIQNSPMKPFVYIDRGSLATIGRASAIADFGRIKLTGLVAWLAWLFIHIMFLVGFRNRATVLFEWAWAYVTFQRSARLITGDKPPKP